MYGRVMSYFMHLLKLENKSVLYKAPVRTAQ